MMRALVKIHRLAPFVVALAVGTLSAPSRAAPVLLDRIVATVEKHPIFRSDVLRRARPYLARLDKAAQTNQTIVGEIKRELTSKMIDELLIQLECERSRINVEPQEIDRALEHLAQVNQIDRKMLLAEAAKQGLSEKEYREELRRQLLEAKWIAFKVRPGVTAPLVGNSGEKARAFAVLVDTARSAELSRLRKNAIVELRW